MPKPSNISETTELRRLLGQLAATELLYRNVVHFHGSKSPEAIRVENQLEYAGDTARHYLQTTSEEER